MPEGSKNSGGVMKRYIGDKKFYKMVLVLAVPIIIQSGITNFVNLLDNIMVGQVGTEQMSGVAIVNQLIFVYNLCIFGIVSGASIFGTQFYGNGDFEGMRNSFRFKIIFCILMSLIGIFILYGFQTELISLYLHEGKAGGSIEDTLHFGRQYLAIMMIGLVPFAISQAYASSLREMGKTVIPMAASSAAVVVNGGLNYILIFGKFGAPVLGVQGAAIATVIAKYVECGIMTFWVHTHASENPFAKGAYKNLLIPVRLVKQIVRTGAPLMINEALWAGGMAVIMQCYSIRGLEVIAGLNISSTVSNIFNIVFMSLGSSVAVVVGQLLGAGKMEEAKDSAGKMIFFSVASCFVIGVVMAVIAPLFPSIYKTSQEVKNLASGFILVSAVCMPLNAFTHASYFVLRSGGKTVITFLFDSVFVWVVSIPAAYVLSRTAGIPTIGVYFICQSAELIKCIIGAVLLKKGVWLKNIVTE